MKSQKKPKSQLANPRFPFFDSVRGFALVIMAIYHFSFDLNQFGVLHQNMNYDEFWLNFRALIMSLFLGLVGVSFVFANPDYAHRDFQKRLQRIAFCAALISLGTYFLNSETWIYFGVLHFILLASLLSPVLIRFAKWAWIPGVLLVALPLYYRNIFFNQPFLILTGLSPIKPNTEDFAPLLPWFGVVCLGLTIGSLTRTYRPQWAQSWQLRPLSRLGKHSLLFYMTHQLVLYPIAWIISQF